MNKENRIKIRSPGSEGCVYELDEGLHLSTFLSSLFAWFPLQSSPSLSLKYIHRCLTIKVFICINTYLRMDGCITGWSIQKFFCIFRFLLVSWLNFLSRKFKQDSADPTDVLGFFQYLVHVLCVQPLRNSKSYLLCASQGLWPSHYRRRTQTLSSQLVEMTREPVPSALHTGLLEGTESFPQKESSILRFFPRGIRGRWSCQVPARPKGLISLCFRELFLK